MVEWYWIFLFYIFVIHVKSTVFSLYVHRGYIHNSIEFTRVGDEVFKFLTWAVHEFLKSELKYIPRALHMKHHARADTLHDPHSPQYYSLIALITKSKNAPTSNPAGPYYLTPDELNGYRNGSESVDTWIDINIYARFKTYSIIVWYPIIFFLYGPIGLILSFFIMPLLLNYGTIIGNYIFHTKGYVMRGGNKGSDKSKNINPIGIVLCGEELHSNHHSSPSRAKLSMRWFEFDIGWAYIRILSFFGLIRIKKHPNN